MTAAVRDWIDEAKQAGEECRLAAHYYTDLGLSVTVCCPPDHCSVGKPHSQQCNNKGKVPLHTWKKCQEAETRLTHAEIDDLFRQNPFSNVGAATGVLVVRVDADGPAGEAKLQEVSGGDVPDTWEFSSGRENGGRGLLYKIPPGVILKTTVLKPDEPKTELRFQAKGAQTVLPPSRHEKGGRYRWKAGHSPADRECAVMPAWLVEALKVTSGTNGGTRRFAGRAEGDKASAVKRASAYVKAMPPAISGQGGHNATYRVACVLVLGFDLTPEEALPIMEEFNERCEPPWTDAELNHKLVDADKEPGERSYLLGDEVHLTDLGNARRVIRQYGRNLRHCWTWKSWLAWDGRRWKEDDTAAVVRCVKQTIGELYRSTSARIKELSESASEEERKTLLPKLADLLKHCISWESAKKISYSLDLMRSEPGIPILPAQLDTDPWLLNCGNGTIDLRTGERREHRQTDYLTKLVPVDYDPAATCPLWWKFLERIFDGNSELIYYLQRAIGYSLTGSTAEQCLWFFHGTGANGKSTFLGTVKDMLGDYACQAVSELLMVKNHEAHPTERADLFGKRFVATIETDEGKRIAEALMKQLTGGDSIRARRMRENFWEFAPTHKIFLAANHKPTVRGTDYAVWRRIKLVPFTVTISDAEKDKELAAKLRGEWPGILRWAVQGCMEWQQGGLREPKVVTDATAKYQQEQDTLAGFLEACCCVNPQLRAQVGPFHEAYQEWSGDHATSQRVLMDRMRERGFEVKLGSGNRTFCHGIGLVQPDPEAK